MDKTKRKKKSKKSSGRLSFKTALFKGAYVHNPVLTSVVGLCSVVGAATNLKNSLVLSVSFLLVICVCEVLASLVLRRFNRWVRVCAYAIVSSAVLLVPMLAFSRELASTLGAYLPLLCVSGVTVIRCEKFAVKTSAYNSFVDSLSCAAGYAVVCVCVGAIRNLLTLKSVFGEETGAAFSMPFAAFLILGFLAALHKHSVMKFFPNEIVDTFGFSSAFEKPLLKDPGLSRDERIEKKKELENEIDEYDKIKPRYSIEDIDLSSLLQKDESKEDDEK